jgi:light-regulated signal transduction histidine kinase (bacteriophytochrome)
VKDNGKGIAKKYHKKIFELFQKLEVDTEAEAIGVRLALVKKIIE